MIHLRNRTEYSFKSAFGRIPNILETNQGHAAGICDRGGTWGHVQWRKECRKRNIKPLYGVELAFVDDMDARERQARNYMAFLAVNGEGLKELYKLASVATEKFYYEPRLDYSVLHSISDNIIMLSGTRPRWDHLPRRENMYVELAPSSSPNALKMAETRGLKVVATGDANYVVPVNRNAYEMVAGRAAEHKATPQHIITEWEWRMHWQCEEALHNAEVIASLCSVEINSAEMVKPDTPFSLLQMCEHAAESRGVDLTNDTYRERLHYELGMIREKNFENYFFVVADICRWAKERMFVGPARGSSCGSLVCYLLSITDIDPIPFDLLFERFIDINRLDLPDIDIDFQDDRRDMVFRYLEETYGHANVARLGTVLRFKPKSAIGDVAKALNVPMWEANEFKNIIGGRFKADERAQFCIADTYADTDPGRKFIAKYPQMRVAADIEGHAHHTGQHASGILVTANPIDNYCCVDNHNGIAQIDMRDAEEIGLLKIDCLGLRTLAILQDILDQVKWTRERLVNYPIDDTKAFAVLNDGHFAGIFQFEGQAVQGYCRKLEIGNFEDMVALSALVRPGPIASGGTDNFIERRMGRKAVEYVHPLAEPITRLTHGVFVYQEQVMQVARSIGKMSWPDVSQLRKAMSKTMGVEFFNKFWGKFREGAAGNGIDEAKAREIWDQINTMGAWAFNRSHAVAYGSISYWCCVLKAHFPLEFAAACLRNAKNSEQSIAILRELAKEGYKYKAFDADKSQINWSVQDGLLVGGLLGIKGVAEKTAADIIQRRREGRDLTARQEFLITQGETDYDTIFEGRDKWGHVYANPLQYEIVSPLTHIADILKQGVGVVVFIAKVVSRSKRDMNEGVWVAKRGGQELDGPSIRLVLSVEDDTGTIQCNITRHAYPRIGIPFMENSRNGDWFIFKGKFNPAFNMVQIARWRKLTGDKFFSSGEVQSGALDQPDMFPS